MRKHVLKGVTPKEVYLDGELLTPEASQKLRNHSPDGFEWGYSGSGPAQLALAVVLKCTGSHTDYQMFKEDYLAPLQMGMPFEIEFDL